jgi:MFS family permease
MPSPDTCTDIASSVCPATSILAPAYRATTMGMVALISLIAFEALAVAAAMPTVAQALDGLPLYALAFGGTLATSVIGMTLAGRWSDARGPAPALWLGLGSFVIGLMLAGTAVSMPMLLAGRLVQGLGGGCMTVALYVLVARQYPDTLRPRLFAAFSAGWVVPSLIGPALSGIIVETIGWRWVFLIVPVLALPAGWLLRPALRTVTSAAAAARPSPSTAPVAWATGAALGTCLLYLGGQLHGAISLALLLPAAALVLFCAQRLLPTGTLHAARGLPSVIALRGLASSAFFATEAFLPLLLSRERGLSPSWAGIALSIGALGWFAGSWYQGHSRNGWSRHRFLRTGTTAMCAGLLLTISLVWPAMPIPVAIAGWALTGLGMGMISASLSVLTLALSAPHEQGRNSSALQLCEALAVAATLAIGGSLFSLLLEQATQAAYLTTFAIAGLAALTGASVVGRIGAPRGTTA